MPVTPEVRIEGLRELNNALRILGGNELAKELHGIHKEIAGDVVARAQRLYRGAYEQRTGKTAGRIRALATRTSASVAIGGRRAPHMLGQEFGSHQFHQFRTWRGSGADAGYFLYPAIRAEAPEIPERYGDVIERRFERGR